MRNKPYFIAEACCNHMGDINIALKMIEEAALCGVECIKFQKRNVKECLSEEQYNQPHPCEINAFGKTYGEHREFLEFTLEDHNILKKKCEMCGIDYSASVWDVTSAKQIASLHPKYIKIPSACNNNLSMLEWLCREYEGKLQISLGMTTLSEENAIWEIVCKYHREKDLILLCCTSGYPVPNDQICLMEIERLNRTYGDKIAGIGFSGHQISLNIDIAAYVLGADYIERHFTLNRDWKGTDQKVSLLPDDLIYLKNAFEEISVAMCYKEQELLPIELEQRTKMKAKKYEEE